MVIRRGLPDFSGQGRGSEVKKVTGLGESDHSDADLDIAQDHRENEENVPISGNKDTETAETVEKEPETDPVNDEEPVKKGRRTGMDRTEKVNRIRNFILNTDGPMTKRNMKSKCRAGDELLDQVLEVMATEGHVKRKPKGGWERT